MGRVEGNTELRFLIPFTIKPKLNEKLKAPYLSLDDAARFEVDKRDKE